MSYILIIMIFAQGASGAPAVSAVEFSDVNACTYAGSGLAEAVKGTGREVRFMCSPKALPSKSAP